MVMNEKELIERDLNRDVWQETLDAVRNIKAGKIGAIHTVKLVPVVKPGKHRVFCRSNAQQVVSLDATR